MHVRSSHRRKRFFFFRYQARARPRLTARSPRFPQIANARMRPYDSDEEADRHAGLRTRALPVADGRTDGAFDDDAPPADGLEYLARVRREAATVPDVMVADAAARRAHAPMLSVATDTTRAARLGETQTRSDCSRRCDQKRPAASAPGWPPLARRRRRAETRARRRGAGSSGVVLGRPRGRRQARRQAPRGLRRLRGRRRLGDAPGDARRARGRRVPVRGRRARRWRRRRRWRTGAPPSPRRSRA